MKSFKELREAKVTAKFTDHTPDKDFNDLAKKNRVKVTHDNGSETTTIHGDEKAVLSVLKTMYGNDWKDMYTKKGSTYVDESVKLDEARQMKDPKKDCMVQKGGKTIVIDKSKEKEYLKKGWSLAESTEVLEEKFVVKYAKNKRGPIYQTKFSTQPEAEKFLAQKKKEGMNGIVSKAGQHTSMQKMKDLQKESVELEEAADFEKMSNELLKKKKLGIEFEKAAAFARVMYMNSSLHVQDRAMKGLLTLIKGIDDLTVKTTLIKILKDNGFKVKGGRVMREEVELEEALVKVTDVEFNYRDQLPNSPKTSDLGAISGEWKQDRIALRNAVKKMGGLVTNTVAPSRGNKWVGTVTIGTRGDPSKLDDKSIQKAVKSHGIEIHGNQFMSESVELDENYRTLATHGMGTETKNSINVGRGVDYYDSTGTKRMGKITKMTRSGYVVKDEKDGKSHTFVFHDRAKAKEIMAKSK